MNDDQRSSQLASLRIERPTESPSSEYGPRARWPLVLAGAAGAAIVVGVGAWLLWGRGERPPSTTVASAEAAPAAAAAPSGPGDLVSSGYVVARRRATVAAEITGRVAEVLVEEGMVVKKGQVLARLDDTLALLRTVPAASARDAQTQAQLEKTRSRILQILQLDKENEQLLLRCSLPSTRPAGAPPAPSVTLLQKIYARCS